MTDRVLRLEGVTKSFPAGASRLEVLRGVSLAVGAGESVAIVGRSGSGKSTLLHLVAALERPDAGVIQVDALDVGSLDADGGARLRRSKVGLVFQSHRLLPYCKALENVLVPSIAWERGPAKSGVVERAKSLLGRLGLASRETHLPSALSGGEAQRVAIARALLASPKVVLADEPTGALDDVTSADVVAVLRESCRAEGAALVVVTHAASVAASMDRVFELSNGVLQERRA